MKKVLSVIVLVCMFCGLLTGCGTVSLDGSSQVVTVNGEGASLGSLITMLRYQQAVTGDYYDSMYAQYEAQGMQLNTGDRWDAAVQESDDEEDRETSGMKVKTSGDRLVDDIATTLVSYLVICQHADEYDVVLTDDEKAKIDVVADNFINGSDKDILESDGITKDGIMAYLQWYTLYDKIYDKYVEESDIVISDEESRNIAVSYLSFSIDSESEVYKTNSIVKKQAQQILDTLFGRDDLSELDFSEFSEQYSNVSAGVDSIAVNAEVDDTSLLSADDVKALSNLKEGQLYTRLVFDGNGTYYIFRLDKLNDADAAATYAEQLKQQKIEEAFYETLDAWRESSDITYNVKLLNQISVTDAVQYTGVKDEESDDVSGLSDVTVTPAEESE